MCIYIESLGDDALQSDLRLSHKLSDAEVDTILKRKGIMNSSTQLGNEDEDDGRESLKTLYRVFVSGKVKFDLGASWGKILSGQVEVVKEIKDVWREAYDIWGLGEFKAYFIGKCLRSRFQRVHLRPVVGPNLKPTRGTGAFVALFDAQLAPNLGRKDLDLLLTHISTCLTAALLQHNEASLVGILDEEIVEHTLCEWYKARRIRDVLRPSVPQIARPLSRHETPAGERGTTPLRFTYRDGAWSFHVPLM